MSLNKMPEVLFTQQQSICGFSVDNISSLPEINAKAYQMYHAKSGAHLLYLHTEDKENLFSVAFKTPPYDDTGLPHILEHTVLCGSKKYPVKDPFVELLKTSLATFLNAMTYPDKTVYPCASMNEADFHNLVNVYCDAVFFPLITEEQFKQEGHHFDFFESGNTKSPLTVKGVVYNEMKGVYSDLNGIISKEEAKSLFPNNAYGKDSGGDPNAIPSLQYNDFVRFHDTYYHPSNAYFFIYGNFDITKTLEILNKNYLAKFNKIQVNSNIKLEAKQNSPVQKTISYPLSKNEDPEKKSAVTVNFSTNNLTDTISSLSMSILENYMLDNASSPLRKALVDSKLGEALTSSGYADYQRDTYFTVGLKGTDPKAKDNITKLTIDTCKKIIENGIDKNKLESSFHKIEFHTKEIQSSYPLILMDRIFNYWLYDADPLCLLKLNSHLKTLREINTKDPRHFEKILEKYIVSNPHYSVLTFVPDKNYFRDQDIKFKKEMSSIKAGMSKNQLDNIIIEAEKLNKMHLTPNTPAALATLPKLSLSQISKKTQNIENKIYQVENRPFIVSDIYSNEINYVNLAFDLRGISEELIDYLPIFKTVFLGMGAGGYNYAEMAEREAAVTGGIGVSLFAEGKFDNPNDCFPYFSISSKALNSKFEGMLKILSDRLLSTDFNDTNRLKDIILQRRTQLRGSILNSGSSYALLHASKNINYNHSLSEKFEGLSYIRFISELAEKFEEKKDVIVTKLSKIKKFILNKNRIYISFVGAPPQEKILNKWYYDLLQTASSTEIITKSDNKFIIDEISSGIIIPSNVSFNAAVFPAVKATNQNAAALLLLSQSLSYGYLWEEIRAKKGAYGARASYTTLGNSFSFSTYRDPCIKETFKTFDNVFNYIENSMKLDSKAVEQAIIGSVKRLDRPIRPGEAAGISLIRYLRNINDEYRQEFRSNLLSLTGKDIKNIALNTLAPAYEKASRCTISGRDKLIEANKSMDLFKFNVEEL
jgi:presequence protease